MQHVDLNQIIDYFPFYFLACDADGNPLYISKNSAQKIYGTPLEELLSVNLKDFYKKGYINRPGAVAEVLESKTSVYRYIYSKTGVHMMVFAEPVFNEDGSLAMVISFSHDEKAFNAFDTEIGKDRSRYSDAAKYIAESDNSRWFHESGNPRMREIYRIAQIAATAESTVVISGESGTGKEVLAKYIHRNGPRVNQPFIPVNCAAIPEELIESEFFGHSKHAFTSANPKGRIGLFEMADKGTLFLDEIGELPLSMQAKLLRAIESGEIRRVGDNDIVNVDVQLIAATNRNLKDMVQTGQFREDLYYRINVISLTLLPLRECREDIIPLANYLLNQINQKKHSQYYFAESIYDFFLKHDWPGNIREMRNIVQLLTVISKGDELRLDDEDNSVTNNVILNAMTSFLPAQNDRSMQTAPPAPPKERLPGGDQEENALRYGDTLKKATANFTAQYVQSVIDSEGGNMTAAAAKLGVHRSTLYKLLQEK
jgi:transcriptional regulator with PAS, ATPase and Fis domain